MANVANENLFLLEFLVDKVHLDFADNGGDVMGDVCVSVQFLDNDPLDICEDDFTPKREYSKEGEKIKSGKSCLFSLTPAKAEEALRKFDVHVDIYKKKHNGGASNKNEIGNSLFSLVEMFNELISSVSSNDNGPQALSAKTLKENFPIKNAGGDGIGEIGIYARMSCFGKLIVTQFQMNLDDKSVLFKDKEGHSLYRYRKISGGRSSTDAGKNNGKYPSGSRGSRSSGAAKPCVTECPTVPCPRPRPSVSINPKPTYASNNNRTSTGAGSCNECPTRNGGNQTRDVSPCNECGAKGLSEKPTDSYQEIGASMGGNALTIRVHKDRTILESGAKKGDPNCACNPEKGGSTRHTSLIMGPGCNNGATTNAPFSFKMAGSGGCTPNPNNVTVIPPVCTEADGTQHTELSDPERDVFVLKINKKSEGAERKQNLELELCTPKAKDGKGDGLGAESQWDDDDANAAARLAALGGGGGVGGSGSGSGGRGSGSGKKKGKGRKGSGSSKDKKGKDDDDDGGFGGGGGHFIGEPKPKKCPSKASTICDQGVPCCFWPPPVCRSPPVCSRPYSTCSVRSDDSYSSPCQPCKPWRPSCRMWC